MPSNLCNNAWTVIGVVVVIWNQYCHVWTTLLSTHRIIKVSYLLHAVVLTPKITDISQKRAFSVYIVKFRVFIFNTIVHETWTTNTEGIMLVWLIFLKKYMFGVFFFKFYIFDFFFVLCSKRYILELNGLFIE